MVRPIEKVKVKTLLAISFLSLFPNLNTNFIQSAHASVIYSFTNAGATGNTGPSQSQVNTAYSGTNLAGLVVVTVAGLQKFTIPYTGFYKFEIAGSIGGSSASVTGGSGARFTTNNISLTQGETITIGVGQIGIRTGDSNGSGGGGASWVYRNSNSALIAIAGGGGGGGISGVTNSKSNAQNDSSGNAQAGMSSGGQPVANGGTNGYGGINSGNTCGLGGAGWLGNGTASATCARASSAAAIAINSTAVGGTGDTAYGTSGYGGFGGGGGGSGSCGYGGGGGGYSGGGGGVYTSGCGGPGGGGGSYSNHGFNWVGNNAAVGFVNVTYMGTLVSTTSVNLAGNATTATFRTSIALIASVDQPGSVTFYARGIKIAGCIKVPVVSTSATCNWKPSIRGTQNISATLSPSNGYNTSSGNVNITVVNRATPR